ncbi:hypothetical protein [Psychrobacter sp. FDAARGOS_221]|uniref:hypothetical protein n=1 Tax=Psychrobacter sp. FDAARGOS_221 TaxID=1975705 RepID=UPI000FDAE7AB|nr:hypothetical protein [Psychrobacter sp. FDAARGOS_221]
MNNMFRLKSTLLTQVDNKWYYQGMPFTGVIFFDKEDSQIAPFIVHNGVITEPYISPCIESPPSIMQVDQSALLSPDCPYNEMPSCWNDIRLCYQDKLYAGMVYDFVEGKCLYENYIDDDRYSGNYITWNTDSLLPVSFELLYKPAGLTYSYDGFRVDEVFFSYTDWRNMEEVDEVRIKYNPVTKKIGEFSATKSVLQDKPYTSCPIPLPDVYKMIDSYQTFTFDEFTILGFDKNIINEVFEIWSNNDSFQDVKKLLIDGLDGLDGLANFSIFNNKQVLGSLTEIILMGGSSLETIETIKATVTNLKVRSY